MIGNEKVWFYSRFTTRPDFLGTSVVKLRRNFHLTFIFGIVAKNNF